MGRLRLRARQMLAPLAHAGFRRFVVARGISALGNGGTRIALTWYVLTQLHSAAWLGAVLIANVAPQFLTGQLGGALADRFTSKTVAVGADVASAVILTMMWLMAITGALSLPLLIAMAALAGATSAVLTPCAAAMVPQIVPREAIGPASGLRTVIEQTSQVVGPALAGAVIAASSAVTWFVVDGASFGIAAILTATVRVQAHSLSHRPAARQMLADLLSSVAFVWRTSWLRTGLLAGAIANFLLLAPLAVALPVIIHNDKNGALILGAYSALLSFGAVVGALVGGVTSKRPLRQALTGLMAAGVVGAIIGGWPAVAVITSLGAVLGGMLAVFEVAWNAYELSHTPTPVLAKVMAWDLWLSFTFRTIGLATIGIAAATSPRFTLIVCGLTLSLLMLLLILSLKPSSDSPTEQFTPP